MSAPSSPTPPGPTPPPDDVGAELLAHLMGGLEPAEAQALEKRLAADETLRAQHDALRAEVADLSRSAAPQPSKSGLARLLDTVEDEAAERRADVALSRSPIDAELGANLTALALGQLSGAAAERVERAIAGDAAAAAELASVHELVGATRTALHVQPRADGAAAVLELIAREGPPAVHFEDLDDVPAPGTARRGRLRFLRWLAPIAIAAVLVVAVSLGLGGRGSDAALVSTGQILHTDGDESGAQAARWIGSESGSVEFRAGDVLEAGHDRVAVRVRCDKRHGAPRADQPLSEGTAELTLEPGARLRRLSASHFELIAGRVDVVAMDLADRLEITSNTLYAAVRGTRFRVRAVGERLVVGVEEGEVEFGRRGTDAASERLRAGQQGLVDEDVLLVRDADGRDGGDAFLTPRATLEAGAETIGVGDDLALTAELAPGVGGAVEIAGFDASVPDFLVRLKGPSGRETEVTVQESMIVRASHALDGGGDTIFIRSDAPYRLELSLAIPDQETGRWEARLRYMSYRTQSRGVEWLGVVESEPVTFEVTR